MQDETYVSQRTIADGTELVSFSIACSMSPLRSLWDQAAEQ